VAKPAHSSSAGVGALPVIQAGLAARSVPCPVPLVAGVHPSAQDARVDLRRQAVVLGPRVGFSCVASATTLRSQLPTSSPGGAEPSFQKHRRKNHFAPVGGIESGPLIAV
jgi:hypothetical protein